MYLFYEDVKYDKMIGIKCKINLDLEAATASVL